MINREIKRGWCSDHAKALIERTRWACRYADAEHDTAARDSLESYVADLEAERDRYLETLAWYAVAEPWEVDADGGSKAWDVLHAAGQGDAIRAARAAIEAAGDNVLP